MDSFSGLLNLVAELVFGFGTPRMAAAVQTDES
jgi:hypothetical protein